MLTSTQSPQTNAAQARPATPNALELEAVVGYLFVVGGRAMRGTPPGARIEAPPKKPQRGREGDTCFLLVTPAGGPQGTAAFYEQLAKRAGDLYFTTSGSVTSGLREAINGVNAHLLTHNTTLGEKYQANLICAVLRGRELFIARSGAVISLLRAGDSLLSAPDDLHDEFALNALPLGYSTAPDIKLARYDIAPGQTLVLGDLGLLHSERETLYIALTAGDNQAMQSALKSLVAPQTQAMIIEFRVPEPAAPKIPEKSADLSIDKPLDKHAVTLDIPLFAPEIFPETRTDTVAGPVLPAFPTTTLDNGAPVPGSEASAPPIKEGPAAPSSAPKPPPKSLIYRVTHGVAWFLRGIAKVINTVLDKILPEPKAGAPTISTVSAIGIAILIPVTVVFIMVGFRLSQVDATNFEQVVSQIEEQAGQAAAIPIIDEERARTLWLAVMQRIETAELQRPGDATLARIRVRAQAALDGFAKVTRKVLVPLRSFPATAQIGGILVQGGTDLYTLDRTANSIYRDTLRQPDQLSGGRGQAPVVQTGSPVGGYTVRNLLDILWVDEGGIRTSHALVGLDEQGFMVTYSPAFPPAQAQALPGSERWKTPLAMRVWQEKLYILDPAANQIWRYVPSGTTYPNPPQEYFDLELNRQLQTAVDFAIDERGSVYVLSANGTMKKYTAGAEQAFALNGVPEGGLRSANAMFLDSSASLDTLYVTDATDQSVFEFTLAGTFQNRFRPTDPAAFKRISALYVEGKRAYIADGNVLYFMDLTPKK